MQTNQDTPTAPQVEYKTPENTAFLQELAMDRGIPIKDAAWVAITAAMSLPEFRAFIPAEMRERLNAEDAERLAQADVEVEVALREPRQSRPTRPVREPREPKIRVPLVGGGERSPRITKPTERDWKAETGGTTPTLCSIGDNVFVPNNWCHIYMSVLEEALRIDRNLIPHGWLRLAERHQDLKLSDGSPVYVTWSIPWMAERTEKLCFILGIQIEVVMDRKDGSSATITIGPDQIQN